MSEINLDNPAPVDFRAPAYRPLFERLQGNILKGHGRDIAVNMFLEFHVSGDTLRDVLKTLTQQYVTSAHTQLTHTDAYRRSGVPGALFGNLFLTRRAYDKLGYGAAVDRWFADPPRSDNAPLKANFLSGMLAASADLGDSLAETGDAEPIGQAYLHGSIDALLLLADDSESFLLRETRAVMTRLEDQGVATVVAVEIGRALRNDDQEGIEHFGYVDGRSQPLFLTSDFRDLSPDGSIDLQRTTEAIDDKARRRESGRLDFWDPFASLSLALLRDPAVDDPHAFGSYFVFRKLEQDVLRFSIAEQQLADKLGLSGKDRERAGAMAVGRFRDGTPLTLSETDGFIPAKANNFRYDGLDAVLNPRPEAPDDWLGLKCPFAAHIRKVNPRQSTRDGRPNVNEADKDDRSHRIVRRGITYGARMRHPNAFQALDDLPTGGVGLLFACFQRSIVNQFAFIQSRWANRITFKKGGAASTGLDPIIGQPGPHVPQRWRQEYGGPHRVKKDALEELSHLDLRQSHTTAFEFGGFVRFRGGEFFFAPSLPFLRGESLTAVRE
jgi:Dyp-type peroxidase family